MGIEKLYTPRADTLAHRVCMHLFANPRAQFTATGIALAFDGLKDVVPNQLNQSLIAGLLVRTRDGVDVFYSAGPNINRMAAPGDAPLLPQPEPIMAAAKQIPAAKAKKRIEEDYSTPYQPPIAPTAKECSVVETAPDVAVATSADCFDALAGIVIELGVPLPTKGKQRGTSIMAMSGLLKSMPVMASAAMPTNLKHMLTKAITMNQQQTTMRYTTRIDKAAQTIRVWRTQ